MTIVNDDSSIISKGISKLIEEATVVIYNHNIFVQLGFSVSKVTEKKVQLNTDLSKLRQRYLYRKLLA